MLLLWAFWPAEEFASRGVWIAKQAWVTRGVKWVGLLWWIFYILELDLHYWCAQVQLKLGKIFFGYMQMHWFIPKVMLTSWVTQMSMDILWKNVWPKNNAVTAKAWLLKLWNMLQAKWTVLKCSKSIHCALSTQNPDLEHLAYHSVNHP